MSADDEATIHIEDEALRDGFTAVPNSIIRYEGISPGAKLAYIVLLMYAWQNNRCFPGQERMAADMRVTDRSIRTYLKELVAAGLISIKRRGLNQTSIYTLHRTYSGAETVSAQDRKQRSGQGRKKDPGKKTQVKSIDDYRDDLVDDGAHHAGWMAQEDA